MKKIFPLAMSVVFVFSGLIAAGALDADAVGRNDWESEVFYQIFPIAFADGNGDNTGDFIGMKKAIPYLTNLGVTALWINPVFESVTYHGYPHADIWNIRSDFGGNAAFFDFVREAHRAGLKVLIDLEIKSLGDGPVVEAILSNGNASNILVGTKPVAVWKDYTGRTVNMYGVSRSRNAVDLMERMGEYWMAPGGDPTAGVDGYRIDSLRVTNTWAILGPLEDDGFYRHFGERIRKIKPSAFLLAEQGAWDTGRDLYASQGIDSAFSFPLFVQGRKAFLNGDAEALRKSVRSCYNAEPSGKFHNIIIENHDEMPRSAEVFKGKPMVEKAAAALLLSLRGIPNLYYGQEIGMKGNPDHKIDPINKTSDANNFPIREPMKWYSKRFQKEHEIPFGAGSLSLPGYANYIRMTNYWSSTYSSSRDNDGISVEEQINDPDSLLGTYRRLISLRKNHPALSKGYLTWVNAGTNVISYMRDWQSGNDRERVLVLVNLADSPRSVPLDLRRTFPGDTDYSVSNLIDGAQLPAMKTNDIGKYKVELGAYEYAFLLIQPGK